MSDKTVTPTSSLTEKLRELGFEFEDGALDPMIWQLATAQRHRLKTGRSSETTVTSSTALVVFAGLDPRIVGGLQAAGLDWDRFRGELGPGKKLKMLTAADVELHPDFRDALEGFASRHRDRREPTPGDLALAIVEMAAEQPGIGRIGKRLREAGADLAALPSALLDALAEPAEKTAPAPNVWICQFQSDDVGGDTLRERGTGQRVTWYWGSHQHINRIRAGDPIVYLRQVDKKKKDRGGIVGTGRVASIEPLPTVFEWRGGKTADGLPTEIVETFVDDLIPRDAVITDPPFPKRKNWRGSVIDLTADQARHINRVLIDRGRAALLKQDTRTEFQPDDAELDRDLLNRGPLAISLARFIHRVWLRNNGISRQVATPIKTGAARHGIWERIKRWFSPPPDSDPLRRLKSRAGFVFHLDAPWGGGKTTFANFVARVLDPVGLPAGPESFLANELRGRSEPAALFLADADETEEFERWPADARRPWIVVNYNAWRNEHVDPPWWVFYQSIRKQCFEALRGAGSAPFGSQGQAPAGGNAWRRRLEVWRLIAREWWWRLKSPKIVLLLLTTLLSVLFLAFFIWVDEHTHWVGNLGIIATSLTGGLSFLWSLAAIVTEAIVPGSDSLAERLSLGKGDPFERFRRHFYDLCERVRRPILVVIDDLDRCRPDAVVGLVRGLQTILRSPRVVYLILGDRDWIERAFEAEHDKMKAIDVGDEQSFGARFVEKAIQISLLLPDAAADERGHYVAALLSGRKLGAERGGISARGEQPLEQSIEELGRQIVRDMDIGEFFSSASRAAEQMENKMKQIKRDKDKPSQPPPSRAQMERLLRPEIVKKAGRSERVQQEVAHQLLPLAKSLPANPRQIKRIINSITVYQQFALMSGLLDGRADQDPPPNRQQRWQQLVLWVVLMIEWPRTWRWLSAYPLLAVLVQAGEDQWDKELTGENEDCRGRLKAAARQIKSEASAMAILANKDFGSEITIDQEAVEWLRNLTPVYRTELPEETSSPP